MARSKADNLFRRRYIDAIHQLPIANRDIMAGKCLETSVGGETLQQDLNEHVDGVTQKYDPSSLSKAVSLFYIDLNVESRAFKKRKWMWGSGVALDDLHRLNPNYVMQYARNALTSKNRFKSDFVLEQVWGNTNKKTTFTDTFTDTKLPDANVKLLLDSESTPALRALALDDLIDVKLALMDAEIGPNMQDGAETPAGSNELFCGMAALQFGSILKENKVQSADYNSMKALVKGDTDTFMGFSFVRTGYLKDQRITTKKLVYNDTSHIHLQSKTTAGSGETLLAADAERMVFWHRSAIARGPVEKSEKSDMGEDYTRLGDQYFYSRCMYGTIRLVDAGCYVRLLKPITSSVTYRKAPVQDAGLKKADDDLTTTGDLLQGFA